MPEPVTAADCRLLLSLLKFAIVAPDQRDRVEAWLEAKRAGILRAQLCVESRELDALAVAGWDTADIQRLILGQQGDRLP